ncbi:MAG TPA: hypothetical protein VLG50_05010 [Candidatus Saccharimonadales bacterium]|nr:hypothetical protein [Candidatus Saccharimonadales bacterium]
MDHMAETRKAIALMLGGKKFWEVYCRFNGIKNDDDESYESDDEVLNVLKYRQ